MKLFISSDMEGTCGITHWDETDNNKGAHHYEYFRGQMTREVAAACSGALEAGATEIRVKDAHDSGRNIIATELPLGVNLDRSFSGHPFSMVQGLDEGFDALGFTGYHSPAHGDGNALSHTFTLTADEVIINGKRASEFTLWSYTAAMLKIPVIFLSGDEALCQLAKDFIPGITVVGVNRGRGGSVMSIHPKEAEARIKEGMKQAVKKVKETGSKDCIVQLPPSFEMVIKFKEHARAFSKSFYPGVKQVNEKTISYTTTDYMEIMRCLHFVI